MRKTTSMGMLFALSMGLTFSSVYADTIIGKLSKDENGQFKINTTQGEKVVLEIDKQYTEFLPSLTSTYLEKIQNDKEQYLPEIFLRFDGIKTAKGFKAEKSPRSMTGSERMSGILTLSDGKHFLNSNEVQFDKTFKVNDVAFDQESVNSYVSKKVTALVRQDETDNLIITAIVPAGIYSANDASAIAPQGIMEGLSYADRKEKIKEYLLKKIYTNEASKNGNSFRDTIFTKKDSEVKVGDQALVITMSGRQGDDPGAIGGHLAAGIATVKEDLSLDMEIWNYYPVPNEKLILSHHNSFLDYYGNLTGGQSNYRPTYTMVMYGVDAQKMQNMRDELDEDFSVLRNQAKPFGVNFNCTTETVKALRHEGIKGKPQKGFLSHLLKKAGAAVLFPFALAAKPFTSDLMSLNYVVLKDPNKFIPRVAFNGYLKNLKKLEKKLNLKRVDYIFQSQTPSARNLGGAASELPMTVNTGNTLYGEMINPESPWSHEKTAIEIENLMKKELDVL